MYAINVEPITAIWLLRKGILKLGYKTQIWKQTQIAILNQYNFLKNREK